mmetsp:Transcript_22063/g.52319  ORF Transcript_22063/g.52319 Transcript_22063/m.52319 type:complete len:166 (-) Transcript_22063:24-521(-)
MLRFVLDRDDLRVVHLEVKLLGVDGHVVRAWILTGDCLVPARHVGAGGGGLRRGEEDVDKERGKRARGSIGRSGGRQAAGRRAPTRVRAAATRAARCLDGAAAALIQSPPPPTQGRARLRERWSTPTFASAFNPFRRLRQCGTPGSAYSLHMYGYGLDIGANVIA